MPPPQSWLAIATACDLSLWCNALHRSPATALFCQIIEPPGSSLGCRWQLTKVALYKVHFTIVIWYLNALFQFVQSLRFWQLMWLTVWVRLHRHLLTLPVDVLPLYVGVLIWMFKCTCFILFSCTCFVVLSMPVQCICTIVRLRHRLFVCYVHVIITSNFLLICSFIWAFVMMHWFCGHKFPHVLNLLMLICNCVGLCVTFVYMEHMYPQIYSPALLQQWKCCVSSDRLCLIVAFKEFVAELLFSRLFLQ